MEWAVVGPSIDKENKGILFWKGETLRVAVGQNGPAVVSVRQRQNKGV